MCPSNQIKFPFWGREGVSHFSMCFLGAYFRKSTLKRRQSWECHRERKCHLPAILHPAVLLSTSFNLDHHPPGSNQVFLARSCSPQISLASSKEAMRAVSVISLFFYGKAELTFLGYTLLCTSTHGQTHSVTITIRIQDSSITAPPSQKGSFL